MGTGTSTFYSCICSEMRSWGMLSNTSRISSMTCGTGKSSLLCSDTLRDVLLEDDLDDASPSMSARNRHSAAHLAARRPLCPHPMSNRHGSMREESTHHNKCSSNHSLLSTLSLTLSYSLLLSLTLLLSLSLLLSLTHSLSHSTVSLLLSLSYSLSHSLSCSLFIHVRRSER